MDLTQILPKQFEKKTLQHNYKLTEANRVTLENKNISISLLKRCHASFVLVIER